MRVLGIETSCDETATAVYDTEQGLLAHSLYSQVKMHAEYGGVVPELASRDHVRKLPGLIDKVMQESGSTSADIDAVAYTRGPGLVGALMVGSCLGRALAYSWGVKAIPVHHMEGHLLAPMLEQNPPQFPFVALLVSGGHTQLVAVQGIGQYQLLGESLDDAAGEAFDKTAKMLGLDYPGGPLVAARAEKGNASRWEFPRPMTNKPGLNFSFSGLKTHTLNLAEQCRKGGGLNEQAINDICAGFEKAVVDTLVIKCRRALEHTGMTRLVIAGGVSANKTLRSTLKQVFAGKADVYYPRLEFCTDNGAMIAFAGAQHLLAGEFQQSLEVQATARWPLAEINQSWS